MQGFNVEHLQEKWNPILNHDGMGDIKDNHRKMVTAVLLENQERMLREEREFLSEGPTNQTGSSIDNFDPVLISLIRRAMPNLVAYDLAGVQPMNGPTGLIFAMRSRYKTQSGDEALFNEADSAFSGQSNAFDNTAGMTDASVGLGTTAQGNASDPSLLNDGSTTQAEYPVGQGMTTSEAEDLGDGTEGEFNEMAFSIEKVTVTAKSRALKAEYSLELAQDLKAIHGLNAEAELANILSTEILAEINPEFLNICHQAFKISNLWSSEENFH